jgi:cathepsin B
MKVIILLALVAISLCNLQSEPYITRQHVENTQNKPFKTFDYEHHPFKGWSFNELKKLTGLKLVTNTNRKIETGDTADLPTHFNSAEQWPDCVHAIRNQGHCGSCWAHAASEVLSDRFCIASSGKVNVVLSPQYLVSCDYIDFGCNGGTLIASWTFLRFFGVVTDSCRPYTAGQGVVDSCPIFSWTCADNSTFTKYYASTYYFFSSVERIKRNILEKGPVETGFMVYEDFLSYKSGIYKQTSDKLLGGHAVKITGWGEEEGTQYWIVANSWGENWGENGYFRIKIGECGFESAVVAGDPSL